MGGSLNLGWENGKRKRRHFYAATAAEVRDELLKARSDQSCGLPVSVERQTVKESLDHWLAESVKSSVRPATYQQYHQHVRLYLGPSLGGHKLSKLSSQKRSDLRERKAQELPFAAHGPAQLSNPSACSSDCCEMAPRRPQRRQAR